MSRTLGGIKIWARNAQELEIELDSLKHAIEDVASRHLCIAKHILKKLVEEALGAGVDERVFSAVLGSSLRSGNLDAVVCGSKNDKSFRIIIHKDRERAWRSALDMALALLRRSSTVQVRVLEKSLFKVRTYNTWSSANYVLARLSYLGTAKFIDNDAFALVGDLI